MRLGVVAPLDVHADVQLLLGRLVVPIVVLQGTRKPLELRRHARLLGLLRHAPRRPAAQWLGRAGAECLAALHLLARPLGRVRGERLG
eukprot:13418914-Alexandrium_andersonii.AAC.1